MRAWNGWYHVNGNTYGTWLRGDPRGWRARWHQEHVEGDYKNPPPPGLYDSLLQHSRRLLKSPPVRFDRRQRKVALRAIVEKLVEIGTEVIAASVDGTHYHVLARFPDGQVRQRMGLAKKHSSHILRAHGLTRVVWARKNRDLPVRDRSHQVNVFKYIVSHASKGAAVWTFREGLYWLKAASNGDEHDCA